MLRTTLFIFKRKKQINFLQSKNFLTNAYRCTEAWNTRVSSPILQKVNLDDLYSSIEKNYSSKGVISAIDVDIFANAIKEGSHLDELRDLTHKLRLSADTCNTLPSTHCAAVRGFVESGRIQEILSVLWDPLNYGIFLDDYTANILMDELLNKSDFERAGMVASLVMLQEEFENEITCALALYSSYKFLLTYKPKPAEQPQVIKKEGKKEKVEEIKIRIKYLRNPYFDDHFDLTDHILRAGKTLAWISESKSDNLHLNLQILGWFFYKKYDKLLSTAKKLSEGNSPRVYQETLEILKTREEEGDGAIIIEDCYNSLSKLPASEHALENDLKILIENAINKSQQNDITQQEKNFKMWEQIREEKLSEQTKRLDEARRIQILEEKQKSLKDEEQKLWFFENSENLELEIEKKFVYYPKRWFGKKKKPRKQDENYIPPEILPKRRT